MARVVKSKSSAESKLVAPDKAAHSKSAAKKPTAKKGAKDSKLPLASAADVSKLEQASVKPVAIRGRDDFLFLTNDSNRLFEQHLGNIRLSNRASAAIADVHKARATRLLEWGGHYRHIIIPNKETVLTDYLPEGLEYGKNFRPPVPRYLLKQEDVQSFSDFEPEFLRQFPADIMYRRNDTHWTARGAYLYMAYIFSKQPEFQSLVRHFLAPMREGIQIDLGDLGSKMPGQDKQAHVTLEPKVDASSLIYDNRLPNRGSVRIYTNPTAPDPRRIVVTHDSFGGQLIGILPSIFASVMTVHATSFDDVLVSALRPDIYLMTQVERFFIRPAQNGQSLFAEIEAIAARKGGQFSRPQMEEALAIAFG